MKKLMSYSIMIALCVTACSTESLVIESPDATKIIEKDRLGEPKEYAMPKGCISNDTTAIARGSFIFHNLNGKKAKKNPPKGLARKLANGKAKQYGNCVACHNIEGAKGAGNIGPDLTSYADIFIGSGVRTMQFAYQKIADPRIDNTNTHMTVNLTTGLFSEKEICDITSYVVAKKK